MKKALKIVGIVAGIVVVGIVGGLCAIVATTNWDEDDWL